MSARIRVAISIAAVALAAAPAAMAAGFPDRPIQLIAPYTAGGAADVLARVIGKELGAKLGQPVVIVNKPGAGTIIGAQAVATAEPNGYTLLLSSNSTFSMNPAVYPKLPYNPASDFEPVGMVATLALAILVQQTAPFADVGQLVAAAKAEPTKYMYASFGNATSSHFAAEMFKAAAGVELTHVPYRGSSPAMTDLLAGQVQVSFDTVVAAVPQIKAGKIKALAVTTARRSSLLPEVPTVAESGYAGFDLGAWIALVGPHGLAPEAKSRLGQALETVMSDPAVQEKLKDIGFEPSSARISDWAAFVTGDIARMREVATRAQMRPD
jgi:tripartite-type tricarboxylate transporter receptor subunit TctC